MLPVLEHVNRWSNLRSIVVIDFRRAVSVVKCQIEIVGERVIEPSNALPHELSVRALRDLRVELADDMQIFVDNAGADAAADRKTPAVAQLKVIGEIDQGRRGRLSAPDGRGLVFSWNDRAAAGSGRAGCQRAHAVLVVAEL